MYILHMHTLCALYCILHVHKYCIYMNGNNAYCYVRILCIVLMMRKCCVMRLRMQHCMCILYVLLHGILHVHTVMCMHCA
jgi:hypothetical protein